MYIYIYICICISLSLSLYIYILTGALQYTHTQAAPNVRLRRTCHFRACRARRGTSVSREIEPVRRSFCRHGKLHDDGNEMARLVPSGTCRDTCTHTHTHTLAHTCKDDAFNICVARMTLFGCPRNPNSLPHQGGGQPQRENMNQHLLKRAPSLMVHGPGGKHTFKNFTVQTHPKTAGKKKTRYLLG